MAISLAIRRVQTGLEDKTTRINGSYPLTISFAVFRFQCGRLVLLKRLSSSLIIIVAKRTEKLEDYASLSVSS